MAHSDLPDDFESSLPQTLAEALRYHPPFRRSSEDAPNVDREFLRRLVRKEISKDLARSAYRLIHAFENWRQAFQELIIEEFAKRPEQEAKAISPDKG